MTDDVKKFGVKMTLPKGDPLSLPHLLGDNFKAERWFSTKKERLTFLDSYQKPFIYYRRGDSPNFEYELISKQTSK